LEDQGVYEKLKKNHKETQRERLDWNNLAQDMEKSWVL
jgi:hypothetical protein